MKTVMNKGFIIIAALILEQTTMAIPAISDGSKGPFNPGSNVTLDLSVEATNGVLNYTTIHIPAGITVRFSKNTTNSPVFLAATGDVVINGTLSVSAGVSGLNPGGYSGGLKGSGAHDGTPGYGPGAGDPGLYLGDHIVGAAGGGGGMAEYGLAATSWSATPKGAGGPFVIRPVLTPGHSGGGGSGGGGGGGATHWGSYSGGNGGEGAGALQISTPGNLTVSGNLLANGQGGSYAHRTALAYGGPGGGGSGGTIELYAGTLVISSNATISAKGGAGGGVSTHANSSCGANGSIGYLTLHAEYYDISPVADIHDIAMWPHPFSMMFEFASTNQYQLQFCNSLLSNDWNHIGLPLSPETGESNRPFTDFSSVEATNRFYRLISIPPE